MMISDDFLPDELLDTPSAAPTSSGVGGTDVGYSSTSSSVSASQMQMMNGSISAVASMSSCSVNPSTSYANSNPANAQPPIRMNPPDSYRMGVSGAQAVHSTGLPPQQPSALLNLLESNNTPQVDQRRNPGAQIRTTAMNMTPSQQQQGGNMMTLPPGAQQIHQPGMNVRMHQPGQGPSGYSQIQQLPPAQRYSMATGNVTRPRGIPPTIHRPPVGMNQPMDRPHVMQNGQGPISVESMEHSPYSNPQLGHVGNGGPVPGQVAYRGQLSGGPGPSTPVMGNVLSTNMMRPAVSQALSSTNGTLQSNMTPRFNPRGPHASVLQGGPPGGTYVSVSDPPRPSVPQQHPVGMRPAMHTNFVPNSNPMMTVQSMQNGGGSGLHPDIPFDGQPQQLDPQHTGNGQMPINPSQSMLMNAPNGTPSAPGGTGPPMQNQQSDLEKRKLIRQQLVLLLHAHKCQQRDREGQTADNDRCTLPHCPTMKDVLNHMTSCKDAGLCQYPHCASSRQILTHWKTCQSQQCSVCLPLKNAANRAQQPQQLAQAGDVPTMHGNPPLYSTHTQGGMPPPNITVPFDVSDGISQLTSTTGVHRGMGNELSVSADTSLQAGQQKKEWQEQVTDDLRNHLVTKLVKAIFPAPDPAAMEDDRLKDLIAYARKVEREMFETASDKDEYYHLLAEKIYKIQKELTEKKDERLRILQQKGQPKQEPGTSSGPGPSGSQSIKNEVNEPNRKMIKLDPDARMSGDDCRLSKQAMIDALMPVWTRLNLHEDALPFKVPVDPVLLQIPDYFDIVKNPMDLQTINIRLREGRYEDPWQFCDDMWLMFENAWLYNRKNSKVHKMCTKLSEVFVAAVDPVMEQLGYCCGKKLHFTPLPIFCYGQQPCAIPRDVTYYCYEKTSRDLGVNLSEKYVYCVKCFDLIESDSVNISDDPMSPAPTLIPKDQFKLLKNDSIDYEDFVDCSKCKRRWHKICALQHTQIYGKFVCSPCRTKLAVARPENLFTAKRLPHCKLSEVIEHRINAFLARKTREEGLSRSEVGEVIIRVLSSSDKEAELKPGINARYGPGSAHPCMAGKFPYRAKAVFAFQIIDGCEVMFFGLHVQEYGSQVSPPNSRRVYIAYLDSVFFFQPKAWRTEVYHEMLLAYLEHVKQHGYLWAHIWACPPSEGDDYIFHCHPPDQKIPKPKRLSDWYKKMLDRGITSDPQIVKDYADIFKQAGTDRVKNVGELPYFEGDFWPNVIEDAIRELDNKSVKQRAIKGPSYEEENGVEELEDLDANGMPFVDDEKGAKTKKNKINKKKTAKKSSGNQKKGKKPGFDTGDDLLDKVMSTMDKFKDVFFVIRLHTNAMALSLQETKDPDDFIVCELMDGRDNLLSMAREKHLEFSSLRRAKYSTLVICYELHTAGKDQYTYLCNECGKPAQFYCSVCSELDFCKTCKDESNHAHQLQERIFASDSSAGSAGGGGSGKPSNRSESIQRCIQSLVHACMCRDANCRRMSCHKMKKVVQHAKTCNDRLTAKCPVCKQMIALCCWHARSCKDSTCVVPFCSNIRQKLEEQQRQLKIRRERDNHRRLAALRGQLNGMANVNAGLPTTSQPTVAPQQPSSMGGVGLSHQQQASQPVGGQMSGQRVSHMQPQSGQSMNPQQLTMQTSQRHVSGTNLAAQQAAQEVEQIVARQSQSQIQMSYRPPAPHNMGPQGGSGIDLHGPPYAGVRQSMMGPAGNVMSPRGFVGNMPGVNTPPSMPGGQPGWTNQHGGPMRMPGNGNNVVGSISGPTPGVPSRAAFHEAMNRLKSFGDDRRQISDYLKELNDNDPQLFSYLIQSRQDNARQQQQYGPGMVRASVHPSQPGMAPGAPPPVRRQGVNIQVHNFAPGPANAPPMQYRPPSSGQPQFGTAPSPFAQSPAAMNHMTPSPLHPAQSPLNSTQAPPPQMSLDSQHRSQ